MKADRELPEGWRRVRFGDVVREMREATKDPVAAGLSRVVGLEHLDSESLTLRRWNELADLPDGSSFTRVFRAGHVLFGKRRAYQRKIAVPDFDGICSSDILVFEPSTDELLPEFLPYLVQSDGFFDHALGTSAGSLSPRTKFQDLAKYEFPIAPPEDQWRTVEILDACHAAVVSLDRSLESLDSMTSAVICSAYEASQRQGDRQAIGDVAELTIGRQKAAKFEKGLNPVRYLRVADLGNLELNFEGLPQMDFTPEEVNKYRLEPGDVLVTEGDLISAMNVGRPALVRQVVDTCCYQNHLIRLRAQEGIDPTFLMAMIEGARLAGVLAAAAHTTTISCLGMRRLSSVELPIAEPATQARIGAEVLALLDFRSQLRRQRSITAAVRDAIQRTVLP